MCKLFNLDSIVLAYHFTIQSTSKCSENNQCVWHPFLFTTRWFSITNLSALAADLVPRIVIDWTDIERTEGYIPAIFGGTPKYSNPHQFPSVPPFFHTLQICQLMPPLSTTSSMNFWPPFSLSALYRIPLQLDLIRYCCHFEHLNNGFTFGST